MGFNTQAFQPAQAPSQGLNYASKAFVPNNSTSNGQTINNITINNFGGNQNKTDEKVIDKLFFPTLDSMKDDAKDSKSSVKAGGMTAQYNKSAEKTEEKEVSDTKSNEGSEQKNNFEFPEGGWECSKCQNYNFKGRKACFRCKKNKSDEDCEGKPEHMGNAGGRQRRNKKSKDEQTGVDGYDYAKDNRVHKYKAPAQHNHTHNHNQERVGDWTCQRCFNHNFSFREVCNMCYLSHQESNKMLYTVQQNRFMVS